MGTWVGGLSICTYSMYRYRRRGEGGREERRLKRGVVGKRKGGGTEDRKERRRGVVGKRRGGGTEDRKESSRRRRGVVGK